MLQRTGGCRRVLLDAERVCRWRSWTLLLLRRLLAAAVLRVARKGIRSVGHCLRLVWPAVRIRVGVRVRVRVGCLALYSLIVALESGRNGLPAVSRRVRVGRMCSSEQLLVLVLIVQVDAPERAGVSESGLLFHLILMLMLWALVDLVHLVEWGGLLLL